MMNRFRIALSCSVLLAALLFLQLRSSGEIIPLRKPLDAFPAIIGDWRMRESFSFDQRTLGVLKLKDYISRVYVNPQGRGLNLYIGYWDTQRKGAQIHSPKNCLPGSGWEPLESARVTIPLNEPFAPINVNRYLIQKDRDQQVVFYWYQSQGVVSASEMTARVEMIKNAALHNRSDGAIIRISSPMYGTVSETSDTLVRSIQAIYPVLYEFLPD